MPPRYAYWTILIDGKATAFRAKEREELLPTLNQLRRKNDDVLLRYFSRGKLWDSPEQAQWADRNPRTLGEKRDRDWRPGGAHRDPRARFDKKPHGREDGRPQVPRGEAGGERKREFERDSRHPKAAKPFTREARQEHDRGWKPKPKTDRDRPWSGKPHSGKPHERDRRDRDQRSRDQRSEFGERRPSKPEARSGDRPWAGKPDARRPWTPKGQPGPRETRDARPHPPKHGDERRRDSGAHGASRWTEKKPWQSERREDNRGRETHERRDNRPGASRKPFNRPGEDRRPWVSGDRRTDQRQERPEGRGGPRKPWTPKSDRQEHGPQRPDARSRARKPDQGGGTASAPPRAKEMRGSSRPKSSGHPRRDDWRTRPDTPEIPHAPDERREAVPRPPNEARPDRPPAAEKIVTKPEPPERG